MYVYVFWHLFRLRSVSTVKMRGTGWRLVRAESYGVRFSQEARTTPDGARVLCRPTGDYRNSGAGDYPRKGTLGNVASPSPKIASGALPLCNVTKKQLFPSQGLTALHTPLLPEAKAGGR